MDLIIASNNKNKVREMRSIFYGLGMCVYSMYEKGVLLEVIEDQPTIEKNSLKKATEVYDYLSGGNCKDFCVLSDDSGLMIDYLGGAPGVMSARFSGHNSSDDDNIRKVLRLLDGVDINERGAKLLTVLTLIDEFGNINQFFGELHGKILNEKKGCNGFGYDSIFFLEEIKKTLAELSEHEKNLLSHRRKALDKLINYLRLSK